MNSIIMGKPLKIPTLGMIDAVCYYDLMSLNWDKVSEIYEDREHLHFIVASSSESNPAKYNAKDLLPKSIRLGICDFIGNFLLEHGSVVFVYYSGGVESFKKDRESFKTCLRMWSDTFPVV